MSMAKPIAPLTILYNISIQQSQKGKLTTSGKLGLLLTGECDISSRPGKKVKMSASGKFLDSKYLHEHIIKPKNDCSMLSHDKSGSCAGR